ncbi:hypothetical protein V6N13_122092 [Hibiscus sabdariffa]
MDSEGADESPGKVRVVAGGGVASRKKNMAVHVAIRGCGTRLNPNVFAVVGSDHYTHLYDIRKYKCDGATDFSRPIDYFYPPHVIVNTNDTFRKTCLAFSDQSELLVSYKDNSIYLFTQDMGPRNNLVPSSPSSSKFVVSGSGNGRVYIWKKKGVELVRAKKEHVLGVDCIESHSHTTVLARSGANGIKIWTPNAIDKAKLPTTKNEQDQQKHSFINSLWSPYLYAIDSTAGQNSGM